MFGFKTLFVILAAATTVVTGMPTSGSGSAIAKRDGAPVALVARCDTCPTTIPDCVSTYQAAVAPIFVQIDAAVNAKAAVDVFVTLWAQVVVELKNLCVNVLALLNVGVSIFAGLTLEACATLFVNICAQIVVKLQACIAIFSVVDLTVFITVFVEICAQIVVLIKAVVQVCVGINVFLEVSLKATIDALVALCATVKVSADVVASLQALLLL